MLNHGEACSYCGEAPGRATSERLIQKQQTAMCIWLTGLSGAGKTSIAVSLSDRLRACGKLAYVLDGDNLRVGLNRDLDFSAESRTENSRRITEVAGLMVDAGLIVIVSVISPFLTDRKMARERFESGRFFEVYVDTPLAECEKRDVKGLYAKARSGVLKDFTGIDSPYEAPKRPDLHIKTLQLSVEGAVECILERIL